MTSSAREKAFAGNSRIAVITTPDGSAALIRATSGAIFSAGS
jgi:hypothetical protein